MNYQNKRSFDFNLIIIFSFILVSLLFLITSYKFIPLKFIYDHFTLRNVMMNPRKFNISDTYNSAAIFFNSLGFHYYTPNIFIQLFSWIIFSSFLLTILRINKYKPFSILQFISIGWFIVIYGIYFNNFSKDLILILFLLIAINLYLNRGNLIYIILFIGIYGLIFRPYWLILLMLCFIFYFQKKPMLMKNIIIIIISLSLFIIIYDFLTNSFITNVKMININANSAMNNLLLNTSIVNDLINYYYSLISLLFPLQNFHVINVLLYYVWIIFNIFLFIIKRHQVKIKMLLILFSYVSIQALFEPDFGSAFRHQLALFPLIYLILYIPKYYKFNDDY